MRTLSRKYASEPRSAGRIRHDVTAFARECGFSGDLLIGVPFAVGEAAANAVEHGHVPSSHIELKCTFDGVELCVCLADSGGGIAHKTWNRIVTKASAGGFGFEIMRAFMDDVSLEREKGAGATLILRKRRRCMEASGGESYDEK